MRVFYGQGAQVGAGVYAGGEAAAAAYAGAVQVHPEGDGAATLEVLATTTHTARAYRLLRWCAEHTGEGLGPMFRVPWERDGESGRFTASGYKVLSVTPVMVYVRLELALPEGVGVEDVRAAVEGGEAVQVCFSGGAALLEKHEFSGWGLQEAAGVYEFENVPFFWGSAEAWRSYIYLYAPEGDGKGGPRFTFKVELNGETVLQGSGQGSGGDRWVQLYDNGGGSGRVVTTTNAACADVGSLRVTVEAWEIGFLQKLNCVPHVIVESRASGLAATHDPVPLELA